MYFGGQITGFLFSTYLLILQLVAFKNVKTGVQEVVSKYAKFNVTKAGNSQKKDLNSMLGRQKLHKHRIQELLVKISSLHHIQFGKL